ncbi:MAG: amidohydrolase family protein [Flavobacteriaceae bacterium]|nr:amidohydrolase family protein [Flavobacteriaceae bacterium]
MLSSRIKISLSIVLFAFLILSCQDSNEEKVDHSNYKVFKGAKLYIGNGEIIENAVIVVNGDRIESVGSDGSGIPDGAEIHDVTGKYITPGMVDSHIHFFQTAFFDSRPDAMDLRDSLPYEEVYDYQKNNPQRYYEAYLRSGVTAVYDVGDFMWTLEFESDTTHALKPHIVSAGPLLTPVPKEYLSTFNLETDSVIKPVESKKMALDHVKNVSEAGGKGIKIWTLNTQDSVFMGIVREIAKTAEQFDNHIIAHATNLDEAKAVLELGAHLLVHSVEDTIVDQEFLDLAKRGPTYYNPTLVVSRGYYNTYKAVLGEEFEITDPNNVVDDKTKTLLRTASNYDNFIRDRKRLEERLARTEINLSRTDSIMAINLKKVYDAGIPIVVGTDAGNPGTIHGISIFDEMEAMQQAGLPPKDIITMATKNGAEAMVRENEIGTIEIEKIADFIILNEDPGEDISNMRSLTHVIRGGKMIDVTKKFED